MIYPFSQPSTNILSHAVSATLKSLRALSDPTRLRVVALLDKDELSVNELQEITRMGQSRISTHLGLLQDSGLVQSRRRFAVPGNCPSTQGIKST